MTNFELIDDYLTGKLSEADKAAFEQQLAADPTLKAEVDLQRQIVEGVRQARVAELKAMLNQVPVGGSASFTNWVGGMAVVAVVGVVTVWYLRGDVQTQPQDEIPAQVESVAPAPEVPDHAAPANPDMEEPKKEQAKVEPKTKVTEKPKAIEQNPVVQPKLDVVDPSGELNSDNRSDEEGVATVGTQTDSKTLEVKIISDGRYDNHYQLDQGVLILYGDFEKTLYEIIEIQSDEPLAFLYHQNRYYKLSGNSNAIQKLVAITDPQLISKLRELRKK
ncbi:MAG: hypothetical protein JNL17_01200 [Cyclobacteriaceae bacterium]|nr:hypothetical protein [Cyclobacteriaceae bacterium]